jgi:RNA polymerase sigma factor (sigma-70 family)
MASDQSGSVRTRPTLLRRLAQENDVESWTEFYRLYGRVVRDFCIKAGLTAAEADDAMQETAIAMARHLPEYRYDPKVCRFKTWLLNQVRWRINDQLRKRRPETAAQLTSAFSANDETAKTATINRVPDPAAADLEALFETEWRKGLLASALERLKANFGPRQLQIFDLLVVQEWPAKEVARSLGVSLVSVYVTRHRVAAAAKKQMRRLERELDNGQRRDPTLPASRSE